MSPLTHISSTKFVPGCLEDEQVYSTEAVSQTKYTDNFTPREAEVGSEHASSCKPIDYTLVSLASKNAMHLFVFVLHCRRKTKLTKEENAELISRDLTRV